MKPVISSFASITAIAVLTQVHTSNMSFIGLEQTFFKDRINNNYMIWQSSVISVLSCLRQCFKLATCMSFFYNEMTKVCSLQGIVYLYPGQAYVELGSTYFVPAQQEKCADVKGFMHNRALEICYNFKCCQPYNIHYLKKQCYAVGTTLMKIDSYEKQNHMAAFLEQAETQFTMILGTRDDDGIYRYDDGSKMTYFNWNYDLYEPDLQGHIYIVLQKQIKFMWLDSVNNKIERRSNLVCETPAQ